MTAMGKGGVEARLAVGADLDASLALRARVFRGGNSDRDAMDDLCSHVLVLKDGVPAATFRIHPYAAGAILHSYSGRRYDLRRLAAKGGVMVELGRFCTDPDQRDTDVIRRAWGYATRLLDTWGASFLFGCTSFPGTEPRAHAAALGLLAARSLAPPDWSPGVASSEVFPITGLSRPEDSRRALAQLPPLLRSYLAMGGRVSDHVVIDRDLGTFHLFTGLDLAAVPTARAATLRDLSR